MEDKGCRGLHSLRLTWKLPEGLCKRNQVFQRGPGSLHVSLGEGRFETKCRDKVSLRVQLILHLTTGDFSGLENKYQGLSSCKHDLFLSRE